MQYPKMLIILHNNKSKLCTSNTTHIFLVLCKNQVAQYLDWYFMYNPCVFYGFAHVSVRRRKILTCKCFIIAAEEYMCVCCFFLRTLASAFPSSQTTDSPQNPVQQTYRMMSSVYFLFLSSVLLLIRKCGPLLYPYSSPLGQEVALPSLPV